MAEDQVWEMEDPEDLGLKAVMGRRFVDLTKGEAASGGKRKEKHRCRGVVRRIRRWIRSVFGDLALSQLR